MKVRKAYTNDKFSLYTQYSDEKDAAYAFVNALPEAEKNRHNLVQVNDTVHKVSLTDKGAFVEARSTGHMKRAE